MQDYPGRKRRRIAIVALLVSLVAGVLLTWWWMLSLSRTEQRLLGSWSVPGSPGDLVITFDADRTYTRHSTRPLGPPSTGYWHVEDSRLVVVHRGSHLLQRGGRIGYTAARLFDRNMASAMTDTFEIVAIEADTIRIRAPKDIVEFIRTDPPESPRQPPPDP